MFRIRNMLRKEEEKTCLLSLYFLITKETCFFTSKNKKGNMFKACYDLSSFQMGKCSTNNEGKHESHRQPLIDCSTHDFHRTHTDTYSFLFFVGKLHLINY